MSSKKVIRRWPYAAVAAAFTAQIVFAAFALAAPKPKDPSGNLDQCANGSTGSPATCTGSAWQNGNLNSNQAHYVEGESAPYRLVLSDMPTTGTNTVVIEYDIMHSGKHALDYLSSFDRTETTADPCSGIGTCAGPSLAAVPAPSSSGSPVAGMPTASFNSLPSAEHNISIYNGASAGTGVTYLSQGVLTDATSSTQVQIQFTATNSTVVLAWGGHIGSSTDWGTGNAAGGISGSPYHMRLISVNGGGGNQDRSLSAGAVAPPPPPAPATLTVTKVVVNDDGGTKVVSDFTLLVNGVQVSSGASNTLPAGSYVVSETPDAGYAGTISGDCDANGNVSLLAGDNKSCTITNNDIAPPPPPPTTGTLTVTKVVTNDDGGTKVVSDFTLLVNGVPVTSGASNTLTAGSYVVSETPDAGYAGTISGDCDANGNVTLGVGESKSCTITNDDIAPPPPPPTTGTLTVTKVVTNDDGGTKVVSDFALFVNAVPVTSGTPNTLAAGSYVVSETPDAGYAGTISGDCDSQGNVTLGVGENKSCTITNDDIALPPQQTTGTLTVTKVVVNDNGGESSVSSFPLFVGETQVTSGEANTFTAGSYVVSETSNQSYTATFSGDCDANGNVTLGVGETKTCTITNDDVAEQESPTLTVFLVIQNSFGGSLTGEDVSIWAEPVETVELSSLWQRFANALVNAAYAAVSIPLTAGNPTVMAPGGYTVMHSNHAGYTSSITGNCTSSGAVTIPTAGNQNCTITLSQQGGGGGGGSTPPAQVTVITVVINDDGGTLGVTDFPASLTTGTLTQTVPGAGGLGATTVVTPGTYLVAGNTSTTYTLTPSGDCSGTVSSGQNKVCTLTYNDPGASTPPAPPAPPTPPPAPPAPTPIVLGATDDLPQPEVLGATTDELPRTGSGVLPMMLAGLTAAAATFVRGRRNKN